MHGFTYYLNDLAKEIGMVESEFQYRHVGLSAQELEVELPETVRVSSLNEEYKTAMYDKVVPLLLEAIKELANDLDKLKGSLGVIRNY